MSAIIYKIWSEKGDKIYVGSTGKQYLCSRKADHLSKYKLKKGRHCSSYDLFDEYGVENCIFEEIERVPNEERYDKERYWLEELKAINTKKRPRWSSEEEKQYFADRFQRLKQDEEWYKARNHRSYLLRKDKLSEPIQCECGKTYTIQHKKRHEMTKFHLSKVNQSNV